MEPKEPGQGKVISYSEVWGVKPPPASFSTEARSAWQQDSMRLALDKCLKPQKGGPIEQRNLLLKTPGVSALIRLFKH